MDTRLGIGLPLLVLAFAASSLAQCPEGWTAAGFHCYKAFDEPRSWVEAESHCQSFHLKDNKAHLASVSDIPENVLLKTWLEMTGSNVTDPWIGLQPVDSDGEIDDDTWTDGSQADLDVWIEEGVLSLEFLFLKKKCLVLNSNEGTWQVTECEQPQPYVCKLSSCPGEWTAYGGRCYNAFTAKKSWVHAEKHCRSFSKYGNAHLVSVADNLENRFLTTMLEDIPEPSWIGMKGFKDDSKTSLWSDDERFDLAAVDHITGGDQVKNNTCVGMEVDEDIVWEDAECKDKRPYVCKLSHCKRGWTAIGGSCMWYTFQKPMNMPFTPPKERKRVRRGFSGFNMPKFNFGKRNFGKFTTTKKTFGLGNQPAAAPKYVPSAPLPQSHDVPSLQPAAELANEVKSSEDSMRCMGPNWTPMGTECKRFWAVPREFGDAKTHCESFTYTGDNNLPSRAWLMEQPDAFGNRPAAYTCKMKKVRKTRLI